MPDDEKTKPPRLLIDAFRASEQATDIGVLMAEEGFDAVMMKVLAAWEKTVQRWKRPKANCPDGGRPTQDAWRWLVDGWSIDYAAISIGANVSRDVARDRCATLLHSHLIYPDGTMAKAAKSALQAAIGVRLRAAGAKSKPEKKDDKVN